MSDEAPYRVVVAPDVLNGRKIRLVGLVSVLVIVACLVLVRLWTGEPTEIDASIRGPAPREISRVEQTLVDVDDNGARERGRAGEKLSKYEWLDREKGIVRIPIERAFDVLTGEAK